MSREASGAERRYISSGERMPGPRLSTGRQHSTNRRSRNTPTTCIFASGMRSCSLRIGTSQPQQASGGSCSSKCPATLLGRCRWAAALRDAGRLEEAIAQYRCVLRTHPDFPAARFGIGSVMQKQGKWEEAIRQEFQPLAVRGSTEAQYYLGWMYDGGRGTPQDDIQTVKWYRMAAAQGHARAQANLGRMYTEGRGVAPDDVEAVKWYRKAATQGLAAVQSYLGLMYAEGTWSASRWCEGAGVVRPGR